MIKQIFVYGSLMEDFFNYDLYLKGHVLKIEPGYVKGTLYDMPYKGYPALIATGSTRVHGEIITIKDYEQIIEAMDEMEGFRGNDDDEYKRITTTVYTETNETLQLGVYFYNLKDTDPNFDQAILINDGSWRNFKES